MFFIYTDFSPLIFDGSTTWKHSQNTLTNQTPWHFISNMATSTHASLHWNMTSYLRLKIVLNFLSSTRSVNAKVPSIQCQHQKNMRSEVTGKHNKVMNKQKTNPCRKSSISCSQNPIWSEDAIERTFSLLINPHMKRYCITEPNICNGLFTRLIGVPVLMWQRQAHAKMTSIWGHFWSVYDLAWPKSSNDHSDMSCSIILHRTCWRDSILLWFMSKDHSILTVRLVTGLDEWTCST